MFGLSKKSKSGTGLKLKIDGMHCTSCSMTIDETLEELDGVFSSKTHYAKSATELSYDPGKVSVETIVKSIEELGYKAEVKE